MEALSLNMDWNAGKARVALFRCYYPSVLVASMPPQFLFCWGRPEPASHIHLIHRGACRYVCGLLGDTCSVSWMICCMGILARCVSNFHAVQGLLLLADPYLVYLSYGHFTKIVL